MTWVFYAVLGLLQLGLMLALFKVPAAKGVDKYTLSVWVYATASVFAGLVLWQDIFLDGFTLLLSVLWGTGYAVLSLLQMHALHQHDTSGLFPFTSLASNVLVVLGGVLFLEELLSVSQWIAVTAALLLFVMAKWKRGIHFVLEVLPLFGLIALLSTFNKFVQKIGADSVEVHNFIFWQILFALLASVGILVFVRGRNTFEGLLHTQTLRWAGVIGVLNFGSTYVIIKALSLGPISLVYVVLGLYTFFTTFFAALLFKEKISTKNIVFILLSFLVVLLIKFG